MTRFERNPDPAIYSAIALSMGAIFVADWFVPLGIAVWIFYIVPVALCLFVEKPELPIAVAFAASIALVLGYFVSPPGLPLFDVRINRSFGLVVTWVTAIMTWQIVRTRLVLRKQAWLRSGQNRLAEQLIGDVHADQLGTNVLEFLATYLDAQVGVFYVVEGDRLRRVAGYALDTSANPEREFRIGESLVGQAAVQKKPLVLRDIPRDYLKVTSGLGARTPTTLIVAPVAADRRVNGVIELGLTGAPRTVSTRSAPISPW